MSFDPAKTKAASPPKKGGIFRYLLPLTLLVVVIGGVAWIGQHLNKWGAVKHNGSGPSTGKSPLAFAARVAQWGLKFEPTADEKIEPRDYEPGQKGHYDFPFKNTSTSDVEIVNFASSCDCTSVLACALDEEQTKQVHTQFSDSPGEPLVNSDKFLWRELIKDVDWAKLAPAAQQEKSLLIKPGAGGVVRVQWTAGKTTGSALNVTPTVKFRTAGNSTSGFAEKLGVPLMVSAAVRFHPQRVTAGALVVGASTTAELYAYSTTRDQFDLKLSAAASDPLFEIETKPVQVGGVFSKCACPDLLAALQTDKSHPHVRAAQRITMTIHESRSGKHLDLGTYHRKFNVKLDGFPAVDVVEPEVVGRVHGEIIIGGADDQGRVRLKEITREGGAFRAVELSANPKWKLEPYLHEPAWLKVKLTEAKEQPDPKQKKVWRLEVTVPENTTGVRSLEDPDAVILRVTGPTERFVRIPVEGQMTGR